MQVGIMVPTAITEIIRALIIIFAVSGIAMLKLPKIKAVLLPAITGKMADGRVTILKKAEVEA